MGIMTNDFKEYCPVCREETPHESFNDNDDTGTHASCIECENEMPLPDVKLDEPFMIGEDVYYIHQGSDDGWEIIDYHAK